jgi:ABC-type transport system involved in cytochrome bd biosynthesis fused ATPase/permease subunit
LKTKNLPQLLLDEPTSSVDEQTAELIWEKLSSLAANSISVIVITHQEKFVQKASRVVRFEE